MKNYYKVGDWNLICDSCGKKIKASHSRHRWDGFIVCDSCFEHRHPQDFVRAKLDKITVPFTRPKNESFGPAYGTSNGDSFVQITYNIAAFACTPAGSSGNSDYGVADCLRADINSFNDFYTLGI